MPITNSNNQWENFKNSLNIAEIPVYWTYLPEENKYIYISPNCKDLTGYEARDFYLNPKLWLNLIQEDKKNKKTKINLVFDELFFETEYLIKTKDDQIKKIKEIIFPIINSENQLLLINGIVFNSEEKETSYKIELVKTPIPYLELILNNDSIAIIKISEKLSEIFLGYESKSKIDSLISNKDFQSFLEKLKKLTHKISKNEIKFYYQIDKRNQTHYYQFIVHNQRININEHLISAFGFDITEFKLNENRLIKLNSDKNKLLSIVSHDLKSPFNSILNFIDMLRSGINISQDEKNEFLNYIYTNAKNQLELIHDMLNWSKIESGLMDFSPTYIQLKQFVNKIISSFGGQAYQKEISFDIKFKRSAEAFFDRNFLKIVLSNIISNAIKFSHKKSKIIIDAFEDEDYTHLTIQDFGIGISERYINLIKENRDYFSQVGTIGEKGSGLGLKFCYDILTTNHGKLQIQSEVNRGTIVKLSFKKPKYNILYYNDDDEIYYEIKSINSSLLPDINIIYCRDIFEAFRYIENVDFKIIILNLDIIKNLQASFIERVFIKVKETTKVIGFTKKKDKSIENIKSLIKINSIINSPLKSTHIQKIVSRILSANQN